MPVDTPRPPPKPRNTECIAPTIAARPARLAMTGSPVSAWATTTGTNPFATSPTATTAARRGPRARSAFVRLSARTDRSADRFRPWRVPRARSPGWTRTRRRGGRRGHRGRGSEGPTRRSCAGRPRIASCVGHPGHRHLSPGARREPGGCACAGSRAPRTIARDDHPSRGAPLARRVASAAGAGRSSRRGSPGVRA